MNIEIRRNTSLSFDLAMTPANKESFKKLLEQSQKLTEEQQELINEGKRKRNEIEAKIWEYLKEHPTKDLDGDLITKETHEIGFDTAEEEIDGMTWVVAKQIYIQPKESCYRVKKGTNQ